MLNKQVFNELPGSVQERLKESDNHGLLANGTKLLFYEINWLPTPLREVKTEKVFVVSRLNEDAILGMLFLLAHQCSLELEQPVV